MLQRSEDISYPLSLSLRTERPLNVHSCINSLDSVLAASPPKPSVCLIYMADGQKGGGGSSEDEGRIPTAGKYFPSCNIPPSPFLPPSILTD